MSENIQDGLYHANLGNLPFHLLDFSREFALEFGPHARAAAINDKFARLTQAPLRRAFSPMEVFEAEVEQGEIVKFCVRIRTGFTYQVRSARRESNVMNLILVLVPSKRNPGTTLFVKTLWFNDATDVHTTLDKSKYVNP